MTTVNEFMLAPEDLQETKAVKVSDKLPEFKLRSLSGTELDQAQRASTVTYKSKGGMPTKTQDQNKFLDKMIELSVVYPDLEDEELQTFYNTIGEPAATVRAMLKAGEYQDLIEAVQDMSGFDTEEEVEEVKN